MSGGFVPIVVSRDACGRLLAAVNSILPDSNDEVGAINWEADVPASQVAALTNAARNFETIFAAEISSLNTYFISQHGIYSTPDLIEHAEMAFDEQTRNIISEGVKKDFREAGRSLAFELGTACGFHAMRAVESALREWHKIICKPNNPPDWAQCVNELRKAGADNASLGILDQIRALHRNPLMHPEDFLSISDAKILFDIATSAIVSIAREIQKANLATPMIPGLAVPAAAAAVP